MRPWRSRSTVCSSSRASGSSALSGSSSSSTRGRRASARARATRWRSPPESVRGERPSSAVTPSSSAARRTSGRCAARPRGVTAPRTQRAARRRPQTEADVAGHVEVREEQGVLVDEADVPVLGRRAGRVHAAQQHAAGRRRAQPGDGLEQHRLAGAARPEEHEVLAGSTRRLSGPSVKPPARTSRPSSPIIAAPCARGSEQNAQGHEHHQRHDDDDERHRLRRLEPEALETLVDQGGDDLGVVGQDHHGAELTDAARPHHHGPGQHAAPGQRQGDPPERHRLRDAERAGHLLVARRRPRTPPSPCPPGTAR